MAVLQSQDLLRSAEVEGGVSASRVSLIPRGFGFGIGSTTGIIAAGLAANSSILQCV